jgi:hypothetical protein
MTRRARYTADPMTMWRTLGLSNGQAFTEAEQMQLSLPVRIAFERVRTGVTQPGDFDTLAAAANTAMVCAESISPFVLHSCQAGQAALMRMLARHTAHGRWGLDGLGLQEVRDTVNVYEQLTALLTAGQLASALRKVRQRMRDGEVLTP